MLGMDNCSDNAHCVNNDGAFECRCRAGYSGDGVNCNDIDECLGGIDDCSGDGACTNVEGSFRCDCNPGYRGDGVDSSPPQWWSRLVLNIVWFFTFGLALAAFHIAFAAIKAITLVLLPLAGVHLDLALVLLAPF